mmetsp:Transcript_14643/g.21636  ORF Transcript_14643/g.21636 Transcript_14643/m.21636 type:complete len:94 (-) Transcript_14643:258-539(-)
MITAGNMEWNRNEVGPWEVFECKFEDDKASFKGVHGKYVGVDGDYLVCDRDEVGSLECFEVVEGKNGNGFALKTTNGKFVVLMAILLLSTVTK